LAVHRRVARHLPIERRIDEHFEHLVAAVQRLIVEIGRGGNQRKGLTVLVLMDPAASTPMSSLMIMGQ
jgi:hypothetical protein